MNYNKDSIREKRLSLRSKKPRIQAAIVFASIKAFLIALILIAAIGSGFLYGSIRGMIASTPKNFKIQPKYYATTLYDDQEKEIQLLSDYSSNRIQVYYEQLPENLKNAFISIEDERFYQHNGVDFRGITRALFNAITHSSSQQGASTITQQLIKNNVFDVGGETNFLAKLQRKIKEQVLALRTEKSFSKEDILTQYLNTINLGKGTLGVQTAAKYYFDKSVEDLTLSECSVLAAITKNPTTLNPADHPEDNNERRELVLKKMYDLSYISKEEYSEALKDNVYARITQNNTQQAKDSVYSWFTDAVITQVVNDLQNRNGYTQAQAYNLVYRGGLKIHTTQSTQLQSIADAVINDEKNYPVDPDYSLEYTLKVIHADQTEEIYTSKDLKQYFANKNKNPDYSVLYPDKKKLEEAVTEFRTWILKEGDQIKEEIINYTIEPQVSYSLIDQSNGHIKVLVGGRGEKQDDLALNRATAFPRQPGSTFKILSTYAPALDTGGMTLATIFDDAPYKYETGKTVHNFEKNKYKGLTTIRDAITDSNNVVAVKALTEITPQVGYDFLMKLGFTTLVQDRVNNNGEMESDVTQALSLGGITDGVENVELTAAYAAIANKGQYNHPVLYTSVEDSSGNIILRNDGSGEQIMKETTAWLLTSAMKDVVKKGTGEEAKLASDMGVAGKTGTTSKNYDYWFCGFTPYYTASIWTGYDYNTSFANDADYHKRIWAKIMNQIITETQSPIKDFDECDGIEKATICTKSGKLPSSGVCSRDPVHSMERTEYFADGSVPKETCDSHVVATVCSSSNRPVGKYCPKSNWITKVFRVRPKGAKGTTDDSAYTMPAGFHNSSCTVHTKKWYEEMKKKQEEEKKKKEEEEKKKLQSNPGGTTQAAPGGTTPAAPTAPTTSPAPTTTPAGQ